MKLPLEKISATDYELSRLGPLVRRVHTILRLGRLAQAGIAQICLDGGPKCIHESYHELPRIVAIRTFAGQDEDNVDGSFVFIF